MVMVGDSCSESYGFKYRHHLLNGHFSHIFVVKIAMFEKTKVNKKRPGMARFIKKRKTVTRIVLN